MKTVTGYLKTKAVVSYSNNARLEVGLTPPRYFKRKGFPKEDKIYLKIKEADHKGAYYFLTAKELLDIIMLGAELLADKVKRINL